MIKAQKKFFLCINCATLLVLVLPIFGCRQDMQDQPKFYPQRSSSFFGDGRSVRPQVVDTVARSQGSEHDYFHEGLINDNEGDGLPFPLTRDVLARGQERYNIYCSPCHSRVGNGMGMIVQRGYYAATSFHSERLREAPLGHFFRVMTKGYGAMPNYAAELTPQDRWAIAAYIRALQLSQNAKREDAQPGKSIETLRDTTASQGLPAEFLAPWFPVAQGGSAAVTVSMATVPRLVAVASSSTADIATGTPTKQTAGQAGGDPARAATVGKSEKLPNATASKAFLRDTAAGQEIYMKSCSACHQPARTGLPPVIPSLIGIVPKVGEERIRTVVREGIPTGKPPMPANPALTSDDMENLIAFLQAGK